MLSAIDQRRISLGQRPHQDNALVRKYMAALRKSKPTMPRYGNQLTVFDISGILPFIFSSESETGDLAARIRQSRLRVLLAIRSIALLRSGDCATIRASSLVMTTDADSRPIMTFTYRGKAARLANMAEESNYIEAISDPRCPIAAIQRYLELRSSLGIDHDFLFIAEKKPFAQLSKDRLSKIVTNLLATLEINATAHALRFAFADWYRRHAISPEDIDSRGGWTSRLAQSSTTRRLHYSSRYCVKSFAQLLFAEL